ncbi:ATP-binding protein [Actinacidiphila alni]|uniref:ATP-binding protein n=1 Tax=Actinacidiphila alni TaxID=380248 RepID=UPI0033F0966A
MRPDHAAVDRTGRDRGQDAGDGAMRVSRSFPGTGGAIAAARQLTGNFLRMTGARGAAVTDDTVRDAMLVVSELVTNAVKHTDGPCGIELRIIGDAVAIAVWDTSPQPPLPMAPDPARIGQHGMEIVSVLCGGFSVARLPSGKQITANLPLNPPAA